MTQTVRKTQAEIQAIIDADIAYMNDGAQDARMHEPGSTFCDAIGFTADRFDGYLFEDGKVCYLSLVVAKQPGQGHFSRVLDELDKLGMEVRVPTPSIQMQAILNAKGFGPLEQDEHGGSMMTRVAAEKKSKGMRP